MISFEHNRIKCGDINEPIMKWEIWWKTPFGYCKTYGEAFKILEDMQMDKNMAMKPVPVALSNSTHEVYDP